MYVYIYCVHSSTRIFCLSSLNCTSDRIFTCKRITKLALFSLNITSYTGNFFHYVLMYCYNGRTFLLKSGVNTFSKVTADKSQTSLYTLHSTEARGHFLNTVMLTCRRFNLPYDEKIWQYKDCVLLATASSYDLTDPPALSCT